MKIWHMTLTALALSATMAMAADQPSGEQGRQLFESTTLGTNGKSCASCHQNGKGLENINNYDDAKLQLIINRCIDASLDGPPLPLDSPEMASLVKYLKSLVTTAKQLNW